METDLLERSLGREPFQGCLSAFLENKYGNCKQIFIPFMLVLTKTDHLCGIFLIKAYRGKYLEHVKQYQTTLSRVSTIFV